MKQTPLKPKLTAAFDATVDGVRINLMHVNLLNDDRERLLGYTPRFEEMGKKSKGTSPAWRCAAPPFRRASAAVAIAIAVALTRRSGERTPYSEPFSPRTSSSISRSKAM